MEVRPHLSLKDIAQTAKRTFRIGLPAGLALILTTPALAQEYSPFQILNIYTQCGGELNGETYPDNHVLMVGTKASTGELWGIDLEAISGQCGNRAVAGDEYISPLPDGVRDVQPVSVGDADGNIYPLNRTYTQCGGPLGVMDFNPTHTLLVDEFESAEGVFTWGVRDLGPSEDCVAPIDALQ